MFGRHGLFDLMFDKFPTIFSKKVPPLNTGLNWPFPSAQYFLELLPGTTFPDGLLGLVLAEWSSLLRQHFLFGLINSMR